MKIGKNWALPLGAAALPSLLVGSLLTLPFVGQLRKLPAWLHPPLLLAGAALILTALAAPLPVAALLGSGLRVLLTAGLLGAGVWLHAQRQELQFWAFLAWGLAAALLVAAIFSGTDALGGLRLVHPYMTANTVGLAAAILATLAILAPKCAEWHFSPPVRILFVFLALGAIVASGSRGALLALLAGGAIGLLQALSSRPPLFWGTLLTFGATGAAVLPVLQKMGDSARAQVWRNVVETLQFAPSGVGAYGLGRHLQPPQACALWPDASGISAPCPPWLANAAATLGNPWLISHNGLLQPLAEHGPIGTGGFFLLVGLVTWAAFRRSPLHAALTGGLLAASLADNTLVMPSPFFAEVFWIVGGASLAGLAAPQGWAMLAPALVGLGGMTLMSGPLFMPPRTPPNKAPQLALLDAPAQFDPQAPYRVRLQYWAPEHTPPKHRLTLRTCSRTTPCQNLHIELFYSRPEGHKASQLVEFSVALPPRPQVLRLELLPENANLRTSLLNVAEWNVIPQVQP